MRSSVFFGKKRSCKLPQYLDNIITIQTRNSPKYIEEEKMDILNTRTFRLRVGTPTILLVKSEIKLVVIYPS